MRLMSITKGSQTISEYLNLAKALADQLAAIQDPVSPTDLVTYVLRGLGPDYSTLVTATLFFPPLPSFPDLRTRLLSFEAQQAMTAQLFSPPQPSAFVASQRLPSSPRGSTPRRSTNFRSSHPRGSQFAAPHRPPTYRSSSTNANGILGPAPFSRAPRQCWTCQQFGHLAAQCPQNTDLSAPLLASMSITPPIPLGTWIPAPPII